ncbi:hypothetical protein [Streptomyces narbonensis]
MALSSSGTGSGTGIGTAGPETPESGTAGPDTPAARRPTRGLLPLLLAGNSAMYALYIGVGGMLLALQIEDIDPANKVANFGLVAGVSAIFATVFNPVAGALPTGPDGATRGSWAAVCSRCR